jgi:cAMP-dependent protein kinase regulator
VLVDGFRVGSVAAGGYFGEKALLRNVPRMATVRSRVEMQLLVLSRDDFLTALTDQPGGAAAPETPTPSGPSGWTHRERVRVLSGLSLLSHFDSIALRKLAEKSAIDQWPAGATIIRRGEEGDRFFVLLEGRAVASVDGERMSELHPGDQFGEIALLHGVRRRADVTATSPVATLSLHADAFLPAVRSQVLLG